VAAVASFLDARAHDGEWLVRIEDVDRTREVPGSADGIVRTLAAFGFEWTGPIVRQSERTGRYEAALETLSQHGLVYPCSCSRKSIAEASRAAPGEEPRYLGWCRAGVRDPSAPLAFRFRVPAGAIEFVDRLQGIFASDVGAECGDFVIKRRDGYFAYQLAVVVDDADQGISHVVRGADLLTSTPRQLLLQRALGFAHPVYAHVPLATDTHGVKLSKSAGAGAVDAAKPAEEICRALHFLRQNPPEDLRTAPLATVWSWAVEHWTTAPLERLRQTTTVASSTGRLS
jgi:glutamyl-Q tRNA(Asp) synthetase